MCIDYSLAKDKEIRSQPSVLEVIYLELNKSEHLRRWPSSNFFFFKPALGSTVHGAEPGVIEMRQPGGMESITQAQARAG